METTTRTKTVIPKKLDTDKITAIKVLGKGAMGTVFLAYDHSSDPSARFPFALKVVEKSLLHSNPDADRRARWEMSVLSGLAHPFLPTLLGSFEAHDLLGWAVPFCSGGDLNTLRYKQSDHVFSPSAIRFYLAEIVCSLAHLHTLGIAYRDLKPENVLVQGSGHVTLTDFDLSCRLTGLKRTPGGSDPFKPPISKPVKRNLTRIFSYGSGLKSARVSPVMRVNQDGTLTKSNALTVHHRESFAGGKRSNSFVGTEEYVSPEVVRGEGHEFGVDWWALGVLAYEMLYGKTPFRGKNRKETFRNVLMMKPEFMGQRTALIDLIERLLEKDPAKRLGHFRGAEEIKEHEFFNGLRWDLLTEVVRPPFVPSTEDFEGLTEKVTTFDVTEYFQTLRAPRSLPSSRLNSLTSSYDDQMNNSLTEF